MNNPKDRPKPMKIVSPLLVGLLALSAIFAAACSGGAAKVVTFTHGAVTPTTIIPGNDGGAVGAVRTFHAEVAADDGTSGTFDATMVTTSVDEAAGLETRLTTIVFSVSDGADQLILSGSAVYPAAGSTIKTADTVIRPIIGGSGRWSGARGWSESTHEADGSWTHAFYLEP
ncbi:MAG: hypothetical protein HQ460_01025 [Chloroflexi bacterium]|nr:hypothetical protein [Chloroflexota bacterium]